MFVVVGRAAGDDDVLAVAALQRAPPPLPPIIKFLPAVSTSSTPVPSLTSTSPWPLPSTSWIFVIPPVPVATPVSMLTNTLLPYCE